ncbi:MAG TPA: hypothetical protein VLK26_03005 [Rudaea sp.]|nr:hypothetical protein [Rudaea sp.]
MMRRLAILAAALCVSSVAWADTGLQTGAATTLPQLPKGNYLSNYYIDVPAGMQQLSVNLNATGGDVDMFVRYGSPFPVQSSGASFPTVSYDLLSRYGQYHSISATSNESVLILPSDKVPLQTGRWYIALINGGSSTANGAMTATYSATTPVGNIVLDFNSPYTDPKDATNNCDISYWTDTTAATPIGGNNGQTLGQQRKNALAQAANELVAQLGIRTTVTVQACGAKLGGTDKSATLAHAGATSFFYDEPQFPSPSLPQKYTWYPSTAAARLNGSSLCGFAGGPCDTKSNDEIAATFNMDIGSSTVLGGENFYLGFDPNQKPARDVDFISIAMHEMTHGLGFLGLVNTDSTQGPLGAKAGIIVDTASNSASIGYGNAVTDGPFDDIFDNQVAIVSGSTYTPFTGYEVNGANDAARAAAMVSGGVTTSGGYAPGPSGAASCGAVYNGSCTGLRWSDATAADAIGININAANSAPNNFPSLYAPCDQSKGTTCAMQNGSTLSHTVQAGDMMNAYYSNQNLRTMGLAVPMLGPIGWSNATATMPTWGQPIPSNWYDVSHSGHGFDFQLAARDSVNGDVYFLTFYTYDANGVPEWYQAVGRLIDGMFLPFIQSANGSTLPRVKYASNAPGQLGVTADATYYGSVVVDFNQAANSAACRNVDRSQASQLAVMYWVLGTNTTNPANDQSASWCMQPIVSLAAHATPDYNGHWYAGSSDSGWGFELLDVSTGSASPAVIVYLYYPGPGNQPAWATASGTLAGNTVTMQVYKVTSGYCRTCTPSGNVQGTQIGNMTLSLNPISGTERPTGTVTFNLSNGDGTSFARTNEAIVMLSLPTGQ